MSTKADWVNSANTNQSEKKDNLQTKDEKKELTNSNELVNTDEYLSQFKKVDLKSSQPVRLKINKSHIVTPKQKLDYPDLFGNISERKTYLHFEYQYLVKKGYILQENGLMIKMK